MKTILLTGASGYLGKALAKAFLKNGFRLVVVARPKSILTYLDSYNERVRIYRTDSQALECIFDENSIDIVVHTAASYGRKGDTLKSVFEANLLFPLNLLELAIDNQVKYFVNTDTALPKNLNYYSKSKKQFLECLEGEVGKINILNLQLEYFYGPNDDSSKFITFLLREFQSGKKTVDFTSATSLRDFIFINDVVDAYLLLINDIENLEGLQNVQIGTGYAPTLKDSIFIVRNLINKEDIKLNFGALPTRENEVAKSCADITYLKNKGWKPKYTFEQGILETIKIEGLI